jgi:3',5'-cyclic AMP phosphodiesterase CpdA
MPFATGVLGGRNDLANSAQLLHALCFDAIELDQPRLSYESRWSVQCAKCAALWIASKAGKVMRIDLQVARPGDRPLQRWIAGESADHIEGAVRAMCHVHRGSGLGNGSFLLLGRDNGFLDLVADPSRSDAPGAATVARFHLQAWQEDGGGAPRRIGDGYARPDSAAHHLSYTAGITAIAVLVQPDQPEVLHLLVATRYPQLYVIEASAGYVRLQATISLPGWINWIICGEDAERRGDPASSVEHITCVSRAGDIVRLTRDELFAGNVGRRTQLSLLPTAAMPLGGDLLLGTATGLFLVRDGAGAENGAEDAVIALPVTRSPVLCLDRTALHGDRRTGAADSSVYDYVAMGLEDGRLRVIETGLLNRLAAGDQRPVPRLHNFAIDMNSAVMAVETLRPDGAPGDAAYVMAVLRDHSVRLFHVTSQDTQRTCFEALWSAHVASRSAEVGEHGARAIEVELAVARAPAPDGCRGHAWSFALVDVVLGRLRTLASEAGDARDAAAVVALACELTRRADLRALYQLSNVMDALCNYEVDLLLPFSRAMLSAVPPGQSAAWRQFIDRHLRDLNAASVRDDQRSRLVAWTRFVRKYVLLGHTFASKRSQLRKLVEENYRASKYLDALIYQVRLAQRHYDVLWDAEVEDEVAELHTVACGEFGIVVVIVTVDAKLAVFDRTGERLQFTNLVTAARPDALTGAPIRALAPFGKERGARSLASTVAPDGAGFRAVLSCTLVPDGQAAGSPAGRGVTSVPARQPRVVVIDVRPARRASAGRTDAKQITAQTAEVEFGGRSDEVHAVRPLPGRADIFVVGLATDTEPVGRLRWSGEQVWRIEPFTDCAARAPDKTPTRALAVAIDDTRSGYLVVAGSDDGLVRVVAFRHDATDAAWTIERWDRVNDAITSVVLGPHPGNGPTPDASTGEYLAESILFSCYLGTASGDTFALSIGSGSRTNSAVPAARFGPHEAEPLWRESLDGPILATRLWRTPLFRADSRDTVSSEPAEILVIVTEKGRLGVYHHAAGNRTTPRVSTQSNYYFRGMRLDRLTVAEQLRAVAVVDGEAEVVVAGPGGKLALVQLTYLLNSVELDSTDATGASRKDLASAGGDLPKKMPARQDHLFLKSVHDVPFRAAASLDKEQSRLSDGDASVALKHELCNLIRIEGGALSHYILDRTWSDRERWDELDTERLRDRVHAHLGPLDPENAEHAELIKVVIKAACRAHLRRDPDAYRELLLAQPAKTTECHLETAALCEIMADYITRKLAYATRAAARLRIVAIKELLRVPVLRHIARDRRDTRVRDAIASALDACLLDEDRLVRIETLRALWVMLRNVAVMADHATERQAFLAALFPDGLGSLEWLLERLIGGLLRFPSFTRRSALISGAWFQVSVLLPVFRIFSDRTLALCNHLIVRGLGLEVVAMCVRSLRGRNAQKIQHRIHHLYLLQALDKPYSRDEYIELYKGSIEAGTPGETVAASPVAERSWYDLDDAALSGELTRLLDRLARMWEAGDDRRMLEPVRLAPDSPYRAIERAIEELSQIAQDLPQLASPARPRSLDVSDAIERLAELSARYRSSVDDAPSLTAPIRTVLSEIVKAWQWICSPPAPDSGTRILDGYVLGAPVVRGSNVFRLREPSRWRDGHVVSIFHKWNHPGAARRFLDAARFTRDLHRETGHVGARHIIEITEIVAERPYYAYVMRHHGESLEARLANARYPNERMAWADHAARQLGRVLELIHRRSGYHGSIKLSHVFVGPEEPNRDPVFFLGGLAHNEQIYDRSLPISGVPESLRQKCQVDDDLSKRRWGDIVALSWVLYQILDGAPLKPIPADPRELDSSLSRLQEEAAKLRVALKNVIAALKQVFDTGTPSFEIDVFLKILNDDSAVPKHPPTIEAGTADPGAQAQPLYRLRILHVSDLHHRGPREGDRARRARVLGAAWRANLAELRADGPFDLVMLTGDVAFSGQHDEYRELLERPGAVGPAETWLDSTLDAVGCTRQQLYVVPGNHDVNRTVNAEAWQRLRDEWSRASQDRDREMAYWFVRGGRVPSGIIPAWHDQVLARQSAYRDWLARGLGRPELVPNPERSRLGYRCTVRLPQLPFDMHVIGLDSAWLAGDDNDARKLRLTDDQILQACTDEHGGRLAGLQIALVHHPLAELADGERARSLLREYKIGLLLSGHLHDPEAREVATPDGKLLELATGCLYQHDRYRNACTALTLGVDATGAVCELELWFRAWSDHGHWNDDNMLYPGTTGGRRRWPR